MDSTPRTLLYIMSPSFSGSTLLTTLLANHPGIATIGELKASSMGDIEKYCCSCGERLVECEFWRAVENKINNSGGHFSVRSFGTQFTSESPVLRQIIKPTVRGPILETVRKLGFELVPGCKSTLRSIIESNRQIVEAVCQLTHSNVFLDSSKDPLRIKYMFESRLWDVRLIYLTRDGRGTSNSHRKYYKTRIAAAARAWQQKIIEMDRVFALVDSSKALKLKYESLCLDTETELNRIFRFAGLPSISNSELKSFGQHILGNDNMRLGSVDEVRLDEKWKRDLTEEDISEFAAVAGATNLRLGCQ